MAALSWVLLTATSVTSAAARPAAPAASAMRRRTAARLPAMSGGGSALMLATLASGAASVKPSEYLAEFPVPRVQLLRRSRPEGDRYRRHPACRGSLPHQCKIQPLHRV